MVWMVVLDGPAVMDGWEMVAVTQRGGRAEEVQIFTGSEQHGED